MILRAPARFAIGSIIVVNPTGVAFFESSRNLPAWRAIEVSPFNSSRAIHETVNNSIMTSFVRMSAVRSEIKRVCDFTPDPKDFKPSRE
jgi:hypothetical protein